MTKIKTMQKLFFLSFLSFFSANLFSQNFTSPKDSDPVAKGVLENMRLKYEAYKSLDAEFTLKMEYPEHPVQSEKGKLLQQGDKYRLTLEGRTIVSDGSSVWLYMEKNKEVQINNVEEDSEEGNINSPQDLLHAYEWKNYIYVLINEFAENGRVIQQIEFKPTDRYSDYSKIRLTVDKKSLDILRIKSFSKDGSRLTLELDKLKPNVQLTSEIFSFTKEECPDCHFEDLRI